MVIMNSRVALFLALVAVTLAQACGKKSDDPSNEAAAPGDSAFVSADTPGVVISETLQRLKGRWVKEIPDPTSPNPPTMKLRAIADNTLYGRLLVSGAYNDVGSEITIRQEGEAFTLVLRDDELRPHGWIPKERVFSGRWDAEKQELSFQSQGTGESLKWQLPGGFAAHYTGSVYRCVVIPTPLPTPGAGGGGGASSGGATTPRPTPTASPDVSLPGPIPVPGSGSTTPGPEPIPRPAPTTHPDDDWNLRSRPPRRVPTAALTTDVSTAVPRASLNSCGIMSSYQEDWSRMSGA